MSFYHHKMLCLPTLLSVLLLTAFSGHTSLRGHFAVDAFGWRGHELTGAVAQFLLTPYALNQSQQLLDNVALSKVAPWADSIKRLPQYQWTKTLHYIDPHDNPPQYCEYVPSRDTPATGSVGTAIMNMTTILGQWHKDATTVEKTLAADALKFLIHFIGDIHQPLHGDCLLLLCSRPK